MFDERESFLSLPGAGLQFVGHGSSGFVFLEPVCSFLQLHFVKHKCKLQLDARATKHGKVKSKFWIAPQEGRAC